MFDITENWHHLIVAALGIGILIVISRLIFKRGVGFKMISTVVSALTVSGTMGFIIGSVPTLGSVVIGTAVMIGVAIGTVALLSRVIAKQYAHRTESVMQSVTQLTATAEETSATAAEQLTAVTQIAATMEELDRMSAGAAKTAEKMLGNATEAVQKGEEGIQRILEATRIVQNIGQVRAIVDTVNVLAEQSNLLAVNASIEAAKAGEVGRGFAVVASEVRNLATQSRGATSQIREAIGRTEDGQRAISGVGQVIDELAKVLKESSDDARKISGITSQQSAGMRQIYGAMESLADGSSRTAAATDQLREAILKLSQISGEFQLGARFSRNP